MLEFIKNVFMYFGFGILIIFPIIWLIGFILKSEKFNEMQDRLRFSLAIIVGIGLWYSSTLIDHGPSKLFAIGIVQEFYPNAKNIKVNSLTESKIESDTYQAYVSFDFGTNSICDAMITIRKGTVKGSYNYRTEGYSCN